MASDDVLKRTHERRIGGATFEAHQVYPRGDLSGIDPVLRPEPGLITRGTRVAAIGSCFAHEIRTWLIEHGYTFVQAAEGPTSGYGSARFGVVLSTGCLWQQIALGFGAFEPELRSWRIDGHLTDPYRANVVWDDEAAAEGELAAHADAVRRLVREAEVLICTMGSAETWIDRESGAWLAKPPPADLPAKRFEHRITSVAENVENLAKLRALVRRENPLARLVVTLSPVARAVTFEDEHCVVSDCVGKATLRVALHEFCSEHADVVYFPSYEIVTRLSEQPFKRDNRHVRREVVGRIMETFIRAFGDGGLDASEPRATTAA